MPWSVANRDAATGRRERARNLKEQGYAVDAIASKLGVSLYTAQEYCRGVKRRAARKPVRLPADSAPPDTAYFSMPNEQFERNRTCLICKTRLCRYNDGPWCWLHAGIDEQDFLKSRDPIDFERLFYWIANEFRPPPRRERLVA